MSAVDVNMETVFQLRYTIPLIQDDILAISVDGKLIEKRVVNKRESFFPISIQAVKAKSSSSIVITSSNYGALEVPIEKVLSEDDLKVYFQ